MADAVKATNKATMVRGPVGKTLFKLTIPMIFGMISMVAFNLVDTFFVGQLGTLELAALSFTFPVIMVIGSLALGLGVGASAVISRAIGEGDHRKVQRLTTNSLTLAVLIVAFFVSIGLLTINAVFSLLGAAAKILPLIRQYMSIWYLGMIFVVVPMVGNNAIRANGDTKTPAVIMFVAVLVNAILDPLLIFGIGPFPRLELAGAAIATVIARASALFVSLYVLNYKYKMLSFVLPALKSVLNSWKRILYIGIPAAGSRLIVPLTIGIITKFVSSYGPEAVAAFGVSTRIEFFTMAAVFALASVLGPFVGQNWGAQKQERMNLGIKYSKLFSLGWGAAMFIVLAMAARLIASMFSKNPAVISGIVLYLRIVPLGYGLMGVFVLSTFTLNVLNRPLHAAALSFTEMLVLYVPLAYIGSYFFGLWGVFAALALAYFIAGIAAHFVLARVLTVEKAAMALAPASK